MARTKKQPDVPKRPRGRPCLYTPAIAAEIIERLSKGEPLAHICADDHMPEVRTVNEWTTESRHKSIPATFGADFARARQDGYDALAAEALRIANTPFEGVETVTKDDGRVEERRGDMLGHRKLQIWTRLQLLAKWDPKRYGDKQQVEHSGNIGIGERLRRAEERLKDDD